MRAREATQLLRKPRLASAIQPRQPFVLAIRESQSQ
jgi:hypothetical protein